jgi:hypothetical protein
MKQATKEGIERFKAAMERVRSGESESETVELGSGTVCLKPDPDSPNGLRIEAIEGEGLESGRPAMDPKQKAFFERMRETIERMHSGETDSAELELPDGGTMRMTRDPETSGAFTMVAGDGGFELRSVTFEAGESRPDGYPEDLPFLPGATVGLQTITGPDVRTLQWFKLDDADGAFERIRGELEEDGWEGGEPGQVSTLYGRTTSVDYKRGDRIRSLLFTRGEEFSMLRLADRPAMDRRTG